jgi:uncharacterized membrane protein
LLKAGLMLKEFLEKNTKNFNYSNYVFAKIQVLIFLMLLALFLKEVFFEAMAVIEALLITGYAYAVWEMLKHVKKEDFKAYAVFFSGILFFVQGIWVIPIFIANGFIAQYYFLFTLLILLLVFVLAFSIFFGRKYTIGKVVSSTGKKAVVQTDFDLRSFTLGGEFIVEETEKHRGGEKVKIERQKGFSGRKPSKIK